MKMSNNKKNVLDLLQVLSASRQLVSAAVGEECIIIIEPVMLIDENNELKQYISHSICKESEEVEAKNTIRELDGLTKDDFIEKNPYCHISTYPTDEAGQFLISFDPEDDIPHKAEISRGYPYLDYFFLKFNNMRNNLIDNNEIVKEDDIYQYLYLVLNSYEKSKKKESTYEKIKKRIMNRK